MVTSCCENTNFDHRCFFSFRAEWFEFRVQIFVNVGVYIKVGLFFGMFEASPSMHIFCLFAKLGLTKCVFVFRLPFGRGDGNLSF